MNNINLMKSPNFTSIFVKRTPVVKLNNDRSYDVSDVSLVELDKSNPKDAKALYKATMAWTKNGAEFASDIYHDFVKTKEFENVQKEHFYAVTEQEDDFENLDSRKLLGLMLFSHRTDKCLTDELSWLQVRPDTNSNTKRPRKYKGVGKALVDTIKERNYSKPIEANTYYKSVNFYDKQGFVVLNKDYLTNMVLFV